ncbi:MAG: PHD finger domain-containing protein [Acidobacteriota bacterium]|nr:PHD finger domain-containing protein [Acidobacteriota bacterium]
MPQIWMTSSADDWQAIGLVADTYALDSDGPKCVDTVVDAPADDTSVLLRRIASTGENTWALLAGPLARPLVNGLPVPLGLVVLADRDEIRWSASTDSAIPPPGPLFFSTERLAAVGPYPLEARRGSCPRCKQPLTPGDAAVRCPGCGLWHHATEALPCWTYGEQCAACPQSTSLEAGFQWTPEGL